MLSPSVIIVSEVFLEIASKIEKTERTKSEEIRVGKLSEVVSIQL
jgi:hypothetical protein